MLRKIEIIPTPVTDGMAEQEERHQLRFERGNITNVIRLTDAELAELRAVLASYPAMHNGDHGASCAHCPEPTTGPSACIGACGLPGLGDKCPTHDLFLLAGGRCLRCDAASEPVDADFSAAARTGWPSYGADDQDDMNTRPAGADQ